MLKQLLISGFSLTLLALTSLALTSSALADGHGKSESVATVASGQTMQTVEQNLGKPSEIISAVGEPPITRWVYPDITVYFEYERVIHSVTNRNDK